MLPHIAHLLHAVPSECRTTTTTIKLQQKQFPFIDHHHLHPHLPHRPPRIALAPLERVGLLHLALGAPPGPAHVAAGQGGIRDDQGGHHRWVSHKPK